MPKVQNSLELGKFNGDVWPYLFLVTTNAIYGVKQSAEGCSLIVRVDIGTKCELVCRILYQFKAENALEIHRTEFMITDHNKLILPICQEAFCKSSFFFQGCMGGKRPLFSRIS